MRTLTSYHGSDGMSRKETYMPTYRVERTHDFTVMANYHLRDDRLSLKSKGLLSLILSLPDDWQFTIPGLASFCRDGKDAVRSSLNELEAAGYIQREQLHSEAGAFAANNYVIREAPPSSGFPTTASPSSGFPSTGFPSTGNPTEQNIDKLNTIPPIAPQGAPCVPKAARKRSPKSTPEHNPQMFERFWALYPRGEDRQGAVGEWDRLKPDEELLRTMSTALKRQIASEDWQRGVGIPYATRWLRYHRWTDEVKSDSPRQGGFEQWT